MREILIGVAHEVGKNGVVNGVCFPTIHHGVLVLKLQLWCIDFELLHAIFQIRVLVVAGSYAYHLGVE